MSHFSLFSAFLAYTLAAALYVAHLVINRPVFSVVARLSLAFAAAFHAYHSVLRYTEFSLHPFADVHEALATVAWLLTIGFLAVRHLQPRLDAAGLFIVPIAQLLLAIGSVTASQVEAVPRVSSSLLVFHVGSAIVGTVALGLASAASLMYLVLERHLKQKRFGAIYQRFPSLDLLDSMAYRCTVLGFPLLTAGIVTGVFTAREALLAFLETGSRLLQYSVGVAGWLLFGAMLQARIFAGWGGHRAAQLTIAGFVCALSVLLLYLGRG